MTSPRRMSTIAAESRRCDNPTVFEARTPSGANPRGLREAEAWRSEDTPSQVSAGLDPSLIAILKDKVFNDESATS